MEKHCQPCHSNTQPLDNAAALLQLKFLPGWKLSSDGKSIVRNLLMKDFLAAVDFINAIANIAEAEDHHPDLHLTGYRSLRIELSTHAIRGLSENDFILAGKIETLPKELKEKK